MDIVCSIDNNYTQHCCVMLASFFANNRKEEHCIHLLTEGLTEANQTLIRQLVDKHRGRFCYYLVDSTLLSGCPIRKGDHLTIATYYRLLMADILPPDLKKVLYLDCDMVINDSIAELWNTPLTGYALAAIEERGCSFPDVYHRLGYSSEYGYFNAGVLLINLAYWREHRLTQTFLNYVASAFDKLTSHDQDVLNALLHDKCLHVSCKWNVEEAFYHYSVLKHWRKSGVPAITEILLRPTILHYTWKPKPWEALCKHPFRINYFTYLDQLPAFSAPKLSFGRKVGAYYDKYLFTLVLKLGIKGHRFYKLQ